MDGALRVLAVSVIFTLSASTAIFVITFMFYIPELFK